MLTSRDWPREQRPFASAARAALWLFVGASQDFAGAEVKLFAREKIDTRVLFVLYPSRRTQLERMELMISIRSYRVGAADGQLSFRQTNLFIFHPTRS